MTVRLSDARLGRWFRSVRVRLLLTYVLAAVVLAVAGVTVFTLVLSSGLRASVDANLSIRTATLASDVQAGNIEQADAAPRIATAPIAGADLPAFTAIYNASGRLVEAQPAILPAAPVTPADLAAPRSFSRTVVLGGERFRVQFRVVSRSDGSWLVIAAQNLNTTNDAAAEVRRSLYVALPLGVLLLGLGAWTLSGAALRPVDRMRADAQRLSEHDPAGRISEPATSDELNQLAQTFNALLGRLHGSIQQQRSLVADAGHELRTPLAVLQVELETAVRPNRTREDLIDSITHAQSEVTRLASLAEDLLLLAQADGASPLIRTELTDVCALVADTLTAYATVAAARSVTLQADLPATPLVADVDPIAIRRILDNLIANAARHTPPGGEITVAVTGSEKTGIGLLRLRVTDTGTGFPEEFLPLAFDRFTRAEQSRSRSGTAGSGLGLAIVATLVRAHGGSVTASNVVSGGGQISIELPTEHLEPLGRTSKLAGVPAL